jgi:hypothetical protein
MCAQRALRRFPRVCLQVGLALGIAIAVPVAAGADEWPGPLFAGTTTLPLEFGPVDAPLVALHADTAAVAWRGVVHVFERAPGSKDWIEFDMLMPGDGVTEFGRSVRVHGATIVVGAAGAAYVFQRVSSGYGWQQVARLTADINGFSFGTSVAVSGTTIVVGAPLGLGPPGSPLAGPGMAYVFEQHSDDWPVWREVARLTGPTLPPGAVDLSRDRFGERVAIDRDTVLIAAFSGIDGAGAYVFSRHHGGSQAWGRVAALPVPAPQFEDTPDVSVSGDTAVVRSPEFFQPVVRIFQRDRGGPNAWGEVRTIPIIRARRVELDGDLLVVSVLPLPPTLAAGIVFSRHQTGEDAWGEVAGLHPVFLPPQELAPPSALAISGDTVFVGSVRIFLLGGGQTPVEVFVLDTDRDGLRDGLDPCPRDPRNNIAHGCQRVTGAYPVLDHLVSLSGVSIVSGGDPFIIRATFTNHSDTTIANPFFEVTQLNGGNVLATADWQPGGTGSTLSPDVGDGLLAPGHTLTVRFVIRLETRDAFQFRVGFRGDPVP